MNASTVSVITLSSDDENQEEPKQLPRKKPKLTTHLNQEIEELVILSDDENNSYVVPINDVAATHNNNHDNVEEIAVNGATSDRDSFDVFLDLCTAKVENEKHKELLLQKMSTIKLLYERVPDHVTSNEFKQCLSHQIKLLDDQPKYALHCFNIIFQQLKHAWACKKDRDVDEHKLRLMKKVQKKLDLLHMKIRNLEAAELSLDDLDDEDSSYIQLQRYKERAKQLFDKLCELAQEDAHTDRIIYKKLRFNASKYRCINQAIRARYRNNEVFPTYYDVDKLIRKCANRNNLEFLPGGIEREIKTCFEALGNLLQKRRKQDLLDIHVDYITCTEDPADNDDSLQNKLMANKKQGEEKLNKICREFVIKQENGEDYIDNEEKADSDNEGNSDSDHQEKSAT